MRLMEDIHENRLLDRWAKWLPRPETQVGALHETDAELVRVGGGRLLALTIDSLLEEVELGLYHEPFTAGRTSVIASLSDLSAVGAEAIGLLMSVTLPRQDTARVQEEVAAGIRDACDAAGVFVLGGDTNEADRLEVTCMAAGWVPEEAIVTRVGASVGDVLFASGPLGAGAALAARVLLNLPDSLYQESDYRPMPRLREGRALRGIASACMDTSDGLVATVDQLARLNDVALRLDWPLPGLLEAKAEAIRDQLGLAVLPFLASQHGEFELVFTVPERRIAELERSAAALGWTPLRLGRVDRGEGMWLGDQPVDGARLRNLLVDSGGDLDRYVQALVSSGLADGGTT